MRANGTVVAAGLLGDVYAGLRDEPYRKVTLSGEGFARCLGTAARSGGLSVASVIYCFHCTTSTARKRSSKEVKGVFHKATDMKLLDGTTIEVVFQDGQVKQYDMALLFGKYPQFRALEDRDLFLSGRLMGAYGIAWNDVLDIETETIYEDGITVRKEPPAENHV